MRRVKGDEGSFYRAILFRFFERLIETNDEQLTKTFETIVE